MNLTINGEQREAADGTTVLGLLESFGLKPEVTVVQRNDDIIDRDRYADTALAEGDCLELIRFVGGG
ncbi:MAG: sulfur carrier protein ThiS [Candidatus Hydrogenedentes bacterium]|nr:sulfur carrier protein ThiS [Candidatus Hydrogenedentota bacterium]